MTRLQSVEALDDLRQELSAAQDSMLPVLVIPAGTCGRAGGAQQLVRAAQREILERGWSRRLRLRVTGCHGFCEMEPSVLVEPEGVFYPKVKPDDMPRIVAAAVGGDAVEDLLYRDSATGRRLRTQSELPFFRKQMRTILSRNEKVDPTRIEDYLLAGGYAAFARVLGGMTRAETVAAVKASGLRGRGGGGFPTGRKWELLAQQPDGSGRVVVCNADEGDPGAYMDRSVLEGNPHAILEGMLIGAYAVGADEGVIYVRMEYPLAIRHVEIALRQARRLGLLGRNILGTDFSFDVSVVRGAGAFVCGEETALLRSIEGKMGEPRQRPPFPVQKGIDGKPTGINNVETWANIPVIFTSGAEAFARVGTRNSSGTKIFSLVGKVPNTGLVEVPMGILLKEIVYDIGGATEASRIKAVQTGGPSGGCIPASLFHLPVDYDSLKQAGAIMGSGGMIVMDEKTCMVDVARYFTKFLKDESCGKCFTCRKGIQRMHELLEDVCAGKGTLDHLDLLKELALAVKDTTLCGLGQTAPNPVLSTLTHFRNEYEEHLLRKRCPAGVCAALLTYRITERCIGCGACVKACSAGAISGARKERHRIDPAKCVKCGACRTVCKANAVEAS